MAQQIAVPEREWFSFVELPATEPWAAPRTLIVAREHVAAVVWIVHQDWLTDPSIPVGQRNTPVEQPWVNVRVWKPYAERWDLLTEPASMAPVLSDEQIWGWRWTTGWGGLPGSSLAPDIAHLAK
ncbi:hypothetical protein [Dactylosporangium sp. NPDC000521]|uniref:hypothetical protein n=1 Tax=Dactylosporangium sp. NPDC000521 TaxID=3363975 RepID=UPI00367ACB64